MDKCLTCRRRESLTPEQANKPGPSVIRKCFKCGHEIWVQTKNLKLNLPLLCDPCAAMIIEEEGGEYRPASEAHKRHDGT